MARGRGRGGGRGAKRQREQGPETHQPNEENILADQTEHVSVKVVEDGLPEIKAVSFGGLEKGEDNMGDNHNEEAQGVAVNVKKKKKPGRKSKKGLVENGDGGLSQTKEVSSLGGEVEGTKGEEVAMRTLRKRPERNKTSRDLEAEENGPSVKKRGRRGRKKVTFVKEDEKIGDLEVNNGKKRGRKRVKTGEEDGNEVGYSLRPQKKQGKLSNKERQKVRTCMILCLCFCCYYCNLCDF